MHYDLQSELPLSPADAMTRCLAAAALAKLPVREKRADGFTAGNQWFGVRAYEIGVTVAGRPAGSNVVLNGRTLGVGGLYMGVLKRACDEFLARLVAGNPAAVVSPPPAFSWPWQSRQPPPSSESPSADIRIGRSDAADWRTDLSDIRFAAGQPERPPIPDLIGSAAGELGVTLGRAWAEGGTKGEISKVFMLDGIEGVAVLWARTGLPGLGPRDRVEQLTQIEREASHVLTKRGLELLREERSQAQRDAHHYGE